MENNKKTINKAYFAILSIFAGIGIVSSFAWIFSKLNAFEASLVSAVINGAGWGLLISFPLILGISLGFLWAMLDTIGKKL